MPKRREPVDKAFESENEAKPLWKRLQALNEKVGLTQQAMAIECACSQPNISYHMQRRVARASASLDIFEGVKRMERANRSKLIGRVQHVAQ